MLAYNSGIEYYNVYISRHARVKIIRWGGIDPANFFLLVINVNMRHKFSNFIFIFKLQICMKMK